ncbi:hypothetical protein, partial [Mariniphaga sediminis]|uniref:hypothetical protein n=1 Tax=Mariniphaga sediminis TaxID=1628158 RepID=UPI003567EA84
INGIANPKIETLQKISEYSGCSIDKLLKTDLSKDNPSELKEPGENYCLSEEGGKLVTALNNISEAVKLNAIANERNSRNMEKMIDLITKNQPHTNKRTGT